MSPAGPEPGCSRIAIVGCGHVGLVTAACLACLGHAVRGIDCDPERIADVCESPLATWEPGLAELLHDGLRARRLRLTTSFEDGLEGADVVFLCVSTPATAAGAANLTNVRSAAASIGEVLGRSGARPVIVNKSTSPIGTADTIEGIFARTFGPGQRPSIATNPEFLREGSAVADFFHPSRIVIGVESPADASAIIGLYRGIESEVIVTDPRTAEMIKYASNAFLATRVSFANELARLCEGLGLDAATVLSGAALDPRVGSGYLSPGIGYGGSCLPKDVAALCHTADSAGVVLRLLPAVQETNGYQRCHAVNRIRALAGGLEGKTVAAWGATFKGGTADLRESPALEVIALIRNEGARVRLFDPAIEPGSAVIADTVCHDPISALEGADVLAVLTDWPAFREVAPESIAGALRGFAVYDGRCLLDGPRLRAAGLCYSSVGDARPDGQPSLAIDDAA